MFSVNILYFISFTSTLVVQGVFTATNNFYNVDCPLEMFLHVKYAEHLTDTPIRLRTYTRQVAFLFQENPNENCKGQGGKCAVRSHIYKLNNMLMIK